ncbi:MAG: glycoside hydrolase family 38 C-terminal domain-containing protein, partial [Acutalibacteraceae bacterium]
MKVFLLCNAHIDPMWQWEWEEGAASAVSTFRCAADFCEEFDGFIFNHNEALLYRWIEEYEPALFARIVKLVKQGKWRIMGGWYLQPDCNMISGESFIGQIEEGLTFFKEKFGVRPRTAINFDSFGHSRGMVQILKKCGYDSYLYMRPDCIEQSLPNNEFLWTGYDGSRIVAHRFEKWYSSFLGHAVDKITEHIEKKRGLENILVLWGVGNHGGGPSRKDLQDIAALTERMAAEGVEIIHSGVEEYFETINPETLPVFSESLRPSNAGCYISQIRIKQEHRFLEGKLFFTKAISAAAAINGLQAYPFEEIREASRDLYLAQFHDILPGSSIQDVESMGLRVMLHGEELLSRVCARMFFALSKGQPKAKDGYIPILVYNPYPYTVETEIDCEFMLADQNQDHSIVYIAEVHDQNGKIVPSQMEKERSNVNFDWRKRVVFRAKLLPSQMNRFDCRMVKQPISYSDTDWRGLPFQPSLAAGNARFQLNNEYMSAAVSPENGSIEYYNVDGKSVLGRQAAVLEVFNDSSDPWAMDGLSMKEPRSRFVPANAEQACRICGVDKPISPVRVVEDGEVRTVIESVMVCEHSSAVITYSIPKKDSYIDISVRIFCDEKDSMFKLSFPLEFAKDAEFIGEDVFGSAVLASDAGEQVAQRWVAVKSGDRAFT